MRVTKPTGSIWVNLGDKYVADNRGSNPDAKRGAAKWAPAGKAGFPGEGIMPRKSLMGIPWRYAIRCIDELGLILRAEVIWSKPNGLPESVKDRVRRSHEQWFYFEQSGGIEAASQSFPFCPLCGRPVDARATLVARLKEANGGVEPSDLAHEVRADERVDRQDAARGDHDVAVGLGRSSVPMLEALDSERGVDAAHLLEDGRVSVVDADSKQRAALPLDERDGSLSIDDAGQPSDVCDCVGHPLIINDEPWIPQSLAAEVMQSVADGECDPQQAADFLSGDYARNHSTWLHFTLEPRYYSSVDAIREPHLTVSGGPRRRAGAAFGVDKGGRGGDGSRHTDGHPLGKLPGSVRTVATEPLRVPDELGVDHYAAFPTAWPRWIIQGWSPEGGVVLDPFGGTGTTALVASVLGRTGISNDMSADYTRIAQWRTTDPKQRAKAAGLKYKQPPKMRAEKPLFETEEEDSCRG